MKKSFFSLFVILSLSIVPCSGMEGHSRNIFGSDALSNLLISASSSGSRMPLSTYHPYPQTSYMTLPPSYIPIPPTYSSVPLTHPPLPLLPPMPTGGLPSGELSLAEIGECVRGIGLIIPYITPNTDLLPLSHISMEGENLDAILALCTKTKLFGLRTLDSQKGGEIYQEPVLEIANPTAIIGAWNTLEQIIESVKLKRNPLAISSTGVAQPESVSASQGDDVSLLEVQEIPRKVLPAHKRKRTIISSEKEKEPLSTRSRSKRRKAYTHEPLEKHHRRASSEESADIGAHTDSDLDEDYHADEDYQESANDDYQEKKRKKPSKPPLRKKQAILGDDTLFIKDVSNEVPNEDEQDVMAVSGKLLSINQTIEKSGLYLFVFLKTLLEHQQINDKRNLSNVVGAAQAVTGLEMVDTARNWLGLECDLIVFKSLFQRLVKGEYKKLKGIARLKTANGLKYYIEDKENFEKLCAYLKKLGISCQQLKLSHDKLLMLNENQEGAGNSSSTTSKNLENLEKLIFEQIHHFCGTYFEGYLEAHS